jgi:drug/metabolite transporter (DMT)-like permease
LVLHYRARVSADQRLAGRGLDDCIGERLYLSGQQLRRRDPHRRDCAQAESLTIEQRLPPPRTDLAALAAGLVTVTLWGSAFGAIRDAGQAPAPGSLALGRLLVGLLVLSVAASIWREPRPRRRDLAQIAAFGVLFLGVYSVTLNAAERRVDASQSGSRGGSGIALLIGAAFAYATAVVIQKPVLARASPLQVTWLGCAAAAVVCLPVAPALVRELDDAGATAMRT